MSDFNEIVAQGEKVGGAARNGSHMELFYNALVNCNLGDLSYQ
jgi:hypothetical protein